MRQIRQQKASNYQGNKQNQPHQMNLPALKHCKNRQNRSKHQYTLNLNPHNKDHLSDKQNHKKTYLRLCNKKKQNKMIGGLNLKKVPRIHNKNNLTISTARLDSSTSQLSDAYMSSRGERTDFTKKKITKGISKAICPILSKHKITIKMRAKMIDWLLEITGAYQLKDQTLFIAINLMDQYFKKSHKILGVNELHTIGVTCIFMASKYEQIYPIQIKTVYRDIGHGKISIKDIISREADILQAIHFIISRDCPFMKLQEYLYFFKISNKKQSKQLNSLSRYFIKLASFDPAIYHGANTQLLGRACIMASIRSTSDPLDLSLYDQFSSICGRNGEDYQKLHQISSQILFLSMNLPQVHQDLQNIMKLFPIDFLNSEKLIQSCAL